MPTADRVLPWRRAAQAVPDDVRELVDIYRSILPFMLLMALTVILLLVFPQIALWLPNLYAGK